MFILLYLVFGILFLMVPHFLLPLHMIEAGRNGWINTDCYFHYHPSWLIGSIIILGTLLALKSKCGRWLVALGGIMGFIQAIALRPLSYYLRSTENLVILGQTISLRAHANIRPTLFTLSLLLLACLALHEFLSRRQDRREPTFFSLPFANLRRKPFRSVALVTALAVVIGAFFTDVLLTRSIGNTLEVGVGRLGADIVVVPKGHEKEAQDVLLEGTPNSFFMPESVVGKLKSLPGVAKLSPQLFFRPFSYLVCCTTEKVLMVGYDPVTDFTIAPWVQYFLNKGQGNDELVVGARVKFYPGQQIAMLGKLLKVVASLDVTGFGYYDKTAFLPISEARELIRAIKANAEADKLHVRKGFNDLSLSHLFDDKAAQESQLNNIDPEGISAIFIKVNDNIDVKSFAESIPANFPGLSAVNVQAATLSIKRQLTAMLDAFFLPIIILIIMGTVILAAIFGMSTNERRREIGLLRALGATQKKIFQLFLAESCLTAGLGCIFGLLSGSALLILFKNKIMLSLDLLYIWPGPGIILQVALLTLFVAALVGIMGGLYPAIKASRMDPYDAFRSNQI
ncbi:MAG: FtsX-like permease family protein [Desulfobulbaceae bacterium]|nr:FtsX-like permease family protein [Desulfobulbaceae bacterium]